MNDLAEMLGDEPGEPLPDALRERMEAAFHADFSDVRVHVGERAWAVNRSRRSVACMQGHRLAFSRNAYAPESSEGQWLIAHELAHVVQGFGGLGNGALDASDIDLEMEAHDAADRWYQGHAITRLSADHSGKPRTWQEAGHYYTVYYVAVAVGFSNIDASLIASRAQIPDEVLEFDATQTLLRTPIGRRAARIAGHRVEDSNDYHGNRSTLSFEYGYALMIQRGFHCLNGNDALEETRIRTEISKSIPPMEVAFGLSLHAFGDSFAHRAGDGKMFHSGKGHFHGTPRETVEPHDPDDDHDSGECVDYLYRRPKDYRDYVDQLYDLMLYASKTHTTNTRKSKKQVLEFIESVTTQSNKTLQIVKIRKEVGEVLGRGKIINAYSPEKDEGFTWESYRVYPKAVHDNQIVNLPVDSISGYARIWNGLVERDMNTRALNKSIKAYKEEMEAEKRQQWTPSPSDNYND